MPVILSVKKCPHCASSKRQELFRPRRDGVESRIVKCNNCNLVYNAIRLREGKKEPIMKKVFLEAPEDDRKRIPYWTAYMKQLKKYAKGNTHLDVGSGIGLLLEGGLKAGFKSKGVEPFAPSAKIAREHGLKVTSGRLSSVKLPPKSVDVLTAIEVIEHFQNPHKEFAALARVLKDDGFAILQTANQDSLATFIQGGKKSYYYYDHLLYFSPKTLDAVLRKAGLRVVKSWAGILPFWQHLKWAQNWTQRAVILKIHAARLLVLNKPILSSMTVMVKKK